MIEHILWDVSSWIYVHFVELQQLLDFCFFLLSLFYFKKYRIGLVNFCEVLWVLKGILVKVKIENYFGGLLFKRCCLWGRQKKFCLVKCFWKAKNLKFEFKGACIHVKPAKQIWQLP
jgi:hypothetical protein